MVFGLAENMMAKYFFGGIWVFGYEHTVLGFFLAITILVVTHRILESMIEFFFGIKFDVGQNQNNATIKLKNGKIKDR